ncbi:TPA: pyruvate ferredoxin oxidoreductase [Candidatus Bipolaricaulota bacterium]|nr:pyruvate ferredoxin oxidoreductase [Candidatus Bipolaricaulota bacterium]
MEVIAATGNDAVAYAIKQINPDVVAAYPITPQSEIVHGVAGYAADGVIDTIMVPVESEHSALSVCIGASASGARSMTATCSQGLALMWEMLYIAASLRLPIVIANACRALSAPINIHCDHSDVMGARDSGFIQFFSEHAQEAYDNIIQAVRIAEDPRVRLPVLSAHDGFITSHSLMRVEVLPDEAVREFVGEYEPQHSLLDFQNPICFGAFDGLAGYYFEHKREQIEAMERAKGVILEVGEEFGRLTGRSYGFFETYQIEDAQVAVVVQASATGVCRIVVDKLRREGLKVGLLRLRVFRPFPADELVEALGHLDIVGVMDRAGSPGLRGGPLFTDLKGAFYDAFCQGKIEPRTKIVSFIYGLGGREFIPDQAEDIFRELIELRDKDKLENLAYYAGLKG